MVVSDVYHHALQLRSFEMIAAVNAASGRSSNSAAQ